MIYKKLLIAIAIFISSFLIYIYTSPGHTAFNHFVLLADSFNKGKIYIEGDMPWLEKIPITKNRFYVANPPMPAITLMMPVLIFGKEMPQEYASFLAGSLLILFTFFISLKKIENISVAVWSSILVGFSTLNWYLISVGSTWYIAHIFAELYLSIAILMSLYKKSPVIIGLLIGFAYLSRIPTILTLPFFIALLPKPITKNIVLLGIGITPSILFNFVYNYLRFGVIWDIGYTLIPGVSSEPWFRHGVINPIYIIEHLKIIFLSIPTLRPNSLDIKPSLFGYAIWFTTPAFIFALKNSLKNKIIKFAWISILLVSLLIFSHGSTGFAQFGYRFAADFYPVLTYLVISSFSKKRTVSWKHWLLLIIGLAVNFWGVLYLNLI